MGMCTVSRLFTVIRLPSHFVMFILMLAPCARAGDLRATVHDARGAALADAVVVAVAEGASAETPRSRVEQVEQIDLEFVPHVKAIQAGTAVSFPNRDSVRHHVYSFSPAKRFELPLYVGTPAQPVVFDHPGIVTIGCNIHDWMVGYLYVSPSPHFATTGADGSARIAGLPAGRYTVRIWHPRLTSQEHETERRLELGATEGAELAWVVVLKPETRVRRAPAPGRAGRY
jgi:plastocyanin